MRNNSTNHSRGIIDSTWGRVPGLHAYSEAEAILEQRLLFVSLCEARMAFTRLWGIIVRIIPEASLTAPEDECLACMLTRKLRPYLNKDCHTWATIALCFIVWGKDGLHKTMRNNSTNHSRDIIDSTWGRVPGLHAHSEAEAILEQRLLFVSLCETRMAFTRLHKTMRNNSTNHSRGIIDSTRGRVPGLHAYSEAEAILEQRLLFVSLCEARMAFTRLWGIIVRIIPEASLTAPEDECLACMLTRKRRPYLSNDCSFVSLCEARMAFTRLWGIIVRIIPEASLTAPEDECLACTLTRERRPYLSKDCYLSFCGTRTAFTETNRSKQLGAVIHLDRMQEALGPHSRAATTMPRVKEAARGREISGQHAGGLGDLPASSQTIVLRQ